MQTPRARVAALRALLAGVLVAAGGGALVLVQRGHAPRPPQGLQSPSASADEAGFSIAAFDRVCKKYVDQAGLVNYKGLKEDPQDLAAFLAQVSMVSPHKTPAAFPGKNEALAYWINAYNAWMMKAVIDSYPTMSIKLISRNPEVLDVRSRRCGQEDLTLNEIRSQILRKEFPDPRVHTALNSASMGSPWLPREAFDPKRLDEQLDREARRFFADPSHLSVSTEKKKVRLSEILNWYQEDFAKWLKDVKGIEKPTVLDYVKLYAPPEISGSLDRSFDVAYLNYDWRLNDQNARWASSRKASSARPQ